MFFRTLTLAALVLGAGSTVAAEGDAPLAQERGKARPLVIMASSSVDPTLVNLQKEIAKPEVRKAFDERQMVLFTVVNTIGAREGKSLDPQVTMALIRELKLSAGELPKVILVGKDGEKKLEQSGPVELQKIFATIDEMPMREREASAPAPVEAAPAEPAQKPGKAGQGSKALDD